MLYTNLWNVSRPLHHPKWILGLFLTQSHFCVIFGCVQTSRPKFNSKQSLFCWKKTTPCLSYLGTRSCNFTSIYLNIPEKESLHICLMVCKHVLFLSHQTHICFRIKKLSEPQLTMQLMQMYGILLLCDWAQGDGVSVSGVCQWSGVKETEAFAQLATKTFFLLHR